MQRLLLSGAILCASLSRVCAASNPYHDPDMQVPFSPPAYETQLLALHRNLVSRESITGNEHDVGQYLVDYLHSLNYTVKKQAVGSEKDSALKSKSRFNVYAYKGSNPKTRALLSSHIDTVPPFYPYELRNSRSEIWGRGSVDAKACVAAQLQAFHELHITNQISDSDLALLFVVGEETGGDGMKTANDLGIAWEAVIFGEPTEGKLVSGHKGLMTFYMFINGSSAHSGYPWLGQSANEILIEALAAVNRLQHRNGTGDGGLPRSDKYGASTVNLGLVQGGVAANVVAEHAMAKVATRLAGGTPADAKAIMLKTIKDATDKLLEKDGEKKATLEIKWIGEAYGPIDIDADVDGFDVITVNYGTDIPHLEGKHKRYLYGPGSIQVAHSDHEHFKVNELYKAVDDYKKLALAVLER